MTSIIKDAVFTALGSVMILVMVAVMFAAGEFVYNLYVEDIPFSERNWTTEIKPDLQFLGSACVELTKSYQVSPATFKVVDATILDFMAPTYWFKIQFDSQNEYGALLRGRATCIVKTDGGNAELIVYSLNDKAFFGDTRPQSLYKQYITSK